MVLYPYVATLTFDGVNRAANAVGQIYAKSDPTFSAPLQAVNASGVAVELKSDSNALLPPFFVEGHTAIVWKSGVWEFPLVTSEPVPGQPGEQGVGIQNVSASGDQMVVTLTDGTELAPFALPTAPGGSDAGVAEYITTPGSETATALSATIADQFTATPTAVAGFGDSMLDDHGQLGVTTLSVIQEALGVPMFDGAQGGQTSTEVAMRQGGLDVFVNVTGGTIPASGPVGVTIVEPTSVWMAYGDTWTFAGSLAGVHGTLTMAPTGSSFTRTATGGAVAVKPELRWKSDATAYSDRAQIFRAGRNNPADHTIVVRDMLAMTKGLTGPSSRYLVIGVLNASYETPGSSGRTNVTEINTALKEKFGPNYYDLNGWLLRNGLAAAGLTATAQDETDIANGIVPASLRYDNTHLNEYGRVAEGNRIAALMVEKGWFPAVAPVAPPAPPPTVTVTNLANNPRAVTSTGYATSSGGGTSSGSLVTTGGPVADAPTFYRGTWTAAATGTVQVSNGSTTTNLVTPGDSMRLAVYARVSWAGAQIRPVVGWYNGSTYVNAKLGTLQAVNANEWVLLGIASNVIPATTTRAQVSVQAESAGVLPPVGGTFDLTAVMLHKAVEGDAVLPYRDGDSADWVWSGAAHASTSTGPIRLS